MERLGLRPVSGRAVGPHERIQAAQQRTGITGVAPYGGIGPAVGVALEPAAETDQLGNLVGHRLVVAERRHALARHPTTDDLVMTKGHATVLETSGLGLGDVVEQRGQANDEVGRGLGDDGDRVRQDVLVTMDRILLHPQRRQLGYERVDAAAVDRRPQGGGNVVGHQNLVESFGWRQLGRRHRSQSLRFSP